MSDHTVKNWGVDLNPSQREVAFSTEKHVVVLAGAGTGKTAAIVHKVAHLIRGGVPRREVLMISDGIDRYYGAGDYQDPYLDAAIDDAQRAGIIISSIYTPGLGHFGHSYYQTYWGQLYLAKLSEKTAGESYYVGFNGPPVAFAPYLDQLSARLTHQYLLTFLAQPPKKAGLQSVKIATEVSNADLVAPDRIYVPAEPR